MISKKIIIAYADGVIHQTPPHLTHNVFTRWSEDGENFSTPIAVATIGYDGNYPARGFSAAGDRDGVTYVLARDTIGGFKISLSVGPELWDRASFEPLSTPQSAPSVAHLDGDLWLIAFNNGSMVQVGVFDYDARAFVTDDVAPVDPLNTEVQGRPAIEIAGSTVVLAWMRSEGPAELVTATGVNLDGVISFDPAEHVPLPTESSTREVTIGGTEPDQDTGEDFDYFGCVREAEAAARDDEELLDLLLLDCWSQANPPVPDPEPEPAREPQTRTVTTLLTYAGPAAAPDLAHDGTDFFMSVVRKSGGGQLFPVVFRSPNGAQWTEEWWLDRLNFGDWEKEVQIAGLGPDQLTLGASGKVLEAALIKPIASTRWTPISSSMLFGGSNPNWTTFSLTTAARGN